MGLFLVSGLVGCTHEKTKDYGGSLRIGIFHKPTEINPITTDSSISANILSLLFNKVVSSTGDGGIKPEVAERWEVSPDRLTWTFHLRRDIRFHDGAPLTADDVKFTFDSILKTKSGGYAYVLKYVKEIRTLDRETVQFLLNKPDNVLWAGLGIFGIAPKHLMENDPNFVQFNRHPIGSGPYRFVKQDDTEIVLLANESYFGGKPFLDQIVVKVLPSQAAALNNLIAGNIDMVFLHNPEDYGALAEIPTIKVYNNWYPLLHMLTLNLKNALFANPEVRRALNLAVNKQRIVERSLRGKGTIAASTFAQGSQDFNPDVSSYPYEPDQALQILQKQGWRTRGEDYILEKQGRRFEFSAFTIDGLDMNTKILQIIQEELRQVGIKMDIEPVSFEEYVQRIFRKRDYESNLVYMVSRPFFDNNFNFWHSSQIGDGLNFSFYSNPEVDRLLEEARLNPDPEKRKAAHQKFQQVLHDDPPGIFLFWREMPIAVHSRFRGIPEKRMEDLRDLVNVWVPREEQAPAD